MSFETKTKVILSSEYLSLDIQEEKEELIPHPEDPIRDMAKNYWILTEVDTTEKTSIPNTDEDNKIYLNEDKNYYTDTLHEEFVKIFEYKYDSSTDEESVTLMQPDPSRISVTFSTETMREMASWVSDT